MFDLKDLPSPYAGTAGPKVVPDFHDPKPCSRQAWHRDTAATVKMTWANEGVAPIYVPCAVALALLDASDQPVQVRRPSTKVTSGGLPPAMARHAASASTNIRLKPARFFDRTYDIGLSGGAGRTPRSLEL
jgi:hypothetical protein